MYNSSYELQIKRDDRWVIQSTFEREDEALVAAEALLKNPKTAGVKVVRDWQRNDGRHVEKVVFEQINDVESKKDLSITPIETAPLCRTDNDLLKSDARSTCNRLFRKYLEEEVLTPTELMHNYQALRKLMYHEQLLPSAVDKVATIHSRASGGDYQEELQQLHAAVDQLAARAREVEQVDLPRLEESTIGAVVDEIERLGLYEDTDFLTMAAVSRELVSWRSWVGKLDFILRVRGDEADARARKVVDGVLADIFGSPVALKEVLGPSKSLIAAIYLQLDLIEGKCEGNRGAAGDVIELLNPLFAHGYLPESRAAVLDYVIRELRSPGTLDRFGEPFEIFDELLERLVTVEGVLNGAEMAEALVERCSRLLNVGGRSGRLKSIAEVIRRLEPAWRKTMFMSDFAGGEMAKDEGMEKFFDVQAREVMNDARELRYFCDARLPPRDKMEQATRAHGKVMGSKLPAGVRKFVGNTVDELLTEYLLREKVIERIDNPELPLRKRAYMLVKFCASGVLIEGKSTAVARQRVADYLRQPNFAERLVEDIDNPAAKERAIRDFYTVLRQSGFGAGA